MGKNLIIKGADFSANAIENFLDVTIIRGKGYSNGAFSDNAARAVAVVEDDDYNTIIKITIGNVTYSAIPIESWMSSASLSVNSGYQFLAAIYQGLNSSDPAYEVVANVSSGTMDLSSYPGYFIVCTLKKQDNSNFGNSDTDEAIGLKIKIR